MAFNYYLRQVSYLLYTLFLHQLLAVIWCLNDACMMIFRCGSDHVYYDYFGVVVTQQELAARAHAP